ncbi:MAG: exodeoxyribonuclease VII large subunit [Alphaproteobacteria bacterium]|nr:exodeoxyribonuclease VII large subunit [Alphaproteobacteria bacterium]
MAEALSNVPEYSVSDLSNAVKRALEEGFDHVRVRGEVGRLSRPGSGHLYFDLKDENAVISAVAWKGVAARWRFQPEQGLEVIVTGRLTTFPGQSKYQIIVETVEPAGIGALMALLEERRKKLAAEGLFDAARKKELPYLPRVIGVVTSPTGAVIRDILHRLADRFPTHVLVWPVRVQGESAAAEIAAAIRGFNALPDDGPIKRPELLIVGRGGGSVEDLWSFNEEVVVRAAAESLIPLISAVGHETDVTLIDYAADRRAPTPTGAAEMAVPVRGELIASVEDLGIRQRQALRRATAGLKDRLRAAERGLPRPLDLLATARQRLDLAASRLTAGLAGAAAQKAVMLARLDSRLAPRLLSQQTAIRRDRLSGFALRLTPAFGRVLGQRRDRLTGLGKLVDSLSYRNVLRRGFALVTGPDGQLVRSAAALADGDSVSIGFSDGARPAIIGGDGPVPPSPKPRPARSKPEADDQSSLF